MVAALENLGNLFFGALEYTGRLIHLLVATFRSAVWGQSHSLLSLFRVLSAQIYFTGWQAMPLVFTVASVTGSLVIFYTANQANPLGTGDIGTTLLYLIVGRELGPLITGFIVIARSGTAVASEIGNMRANGEIEALQAMAIDPLSFVVFPRVFGGIISVVCLVVYFDVIAVLAAFTASVFLTGASFSSFCGALLQQVEVGDMAMVGLKSLMMGTTVFAVSSYQGLRVRKSHHEVPQVAIKAVVISIISVTLLNFILTAVLLIRHFQAGRL